MQIVDRDAIEIGELYEGAKKSLYDSLNLQIACGERLIAKKASLNHGEWIPWLRDNAGALGFETDRTARLLMAAAKRKSTSDLENLTPAELAQENRKVWGNVDRLPKPKPEAIFAPEGKFGCVVIDPPWDMQKIDRDVRPNQVGFDYPVMSEEELVEFGGIVDGMAATNCHLFMWTTQKFLPMSIRLIDVWGWKYVLTMVWHKSGGFQPHDLPQYNCEFAVYGRRGNATFIDTKDFPTCFEAPRREHSRKPDEFYNLISRVTGTSCVDVFSREARDGWAQYGNEVEKF